MVPSGAMIMFRLRVGSWRTEISRVSPGWSTYLGCWAWAGPAMITSPRKPRTSPLSRMISDTYLAVEHGQKAGLVQASGTVATGKIHVRIYEGKRASLGPERIVCSNFRSPNQTWPFRVKKKGALRREDLSTRETKHQGFSWIEPTGQDNLQ